MYYERVFVSQLSDTVTSKLNSQWTCWLVDVAALSRWSAGLLTLCWLLTSGLSKRIFLN